MPALNYARAKQPVHLTPTLSQELHLEVGKVSGGCAGVVLAVMRVIKAILCSNFVLIVKIIVKGAPLDIIQPRIHHHL